MPWLEDTEEYHWTALGTAVRYQRRTSQEVIGALKVPGGAEVEVKGWTLGLVPALGVGTQTETSSERLLRRAWEEDHRWG